tara:strand:- start:61 stop:282 length:222 start_codon:yes stop_codon:yes gene_type:complete
MNPFTLSGYVSNFTDKVRKQIKDVEVGQQIKADLHGATLAKFRMTLTHVTSGTSKKFLTKQDYDKNLWISRIS